MVKLEIGKYYRTRAGKKVGPMGDYGFTTQGYHAMKCDGSLWESETGKSYPDSYGVSNAEEKDIIAEWHDFPVRTVTRKEIVPGVYNKVSVSSDGWTTIPSFLKTPAELRAAIATLIQIAEALETK